MKALKLLAATVAALVALFAVSPEVQARGRVRGGVTFHLGYYGPGYWWGPGYWGPGYWGPRYAYPPYVYDGYPGVYAPPVVVAPAEPPVYIERDAPAQAAAPVWWYWCPDANAYYPYAKECPGGWQRVPPQPVAPAQQNR